MPRSIFRGFVKNIFILLNLLVALLYLVGCYNKIFFSAAWWPVGFLSLSLFYLLILLFAITLGWLPVAGAEGAGAAVLPSVTLGLGTAARLARHGAGAPR